MNRVKRRVAILRWCWGKMHTPGVHRRAPLLRGGEGKGVSLWGEGKGFSL